MMRKTLIAVIFAAVALPAAPAFANPPSWAPAYGHRDNERYYPKKRHYSRKRDYPQDRHYSREYHSPKERYYEPRRMTRHDHVWLGKDGRYHCRRDDGTTGMVIGLVLGGLLGNQIAGYDEKTLGTFIGAAGGALLGREIDRGSVRCH